MSESCSTEQLGTPQSSAHSTPLCPDCGQPGRPVSAVTLKHMVRPEFLELVGKTGFLFCASTDCEIVYYHPDGEVLNKNDLRVRVGLKETLDPMPICYCFGFTERMLLDEIQANGHTTIPQRIAAEVAAHNCACDVRNPQGSCCLGNVKAAVKRAQETVAKAS